MGDFLQSMLTDCVSDLIKFAVLALITAGLTYLNEKRPNWGTTARYALICFVYLLFYSLPLLVVGFSLRSRRSRHQQMCSRT